MHLTYRYRIKDKRAAKALRAHAVAVNRVWNFCAETDRKSLAAWRAGINRRQPTWVDLIKLCAGSSVLLGIHSDTVMQVCRRYASTRSCRNAPLRFRSSLGAKRSLGWVPVLPRAIKLDGATVTYLKRVFRFWKSRELNGRLCAGSFNEDARGRWYINLQVEADSVASKASGAIGIDLGLTSLATLSSGQTVEVPKYYRRYEAALAVAHRAKNKKRVTALNAKIANCRRNYLHQVSTNIARNNLRIVVGNVSPSKLAKTKMAKSVLDAGWSSFRAMLRYKQAIRLGHEYVEVDEKFTTQTCSDCGVVGGPKGITGLEMRAWECPHCGASHDRDVNAARNILRLGRECVPLVGEIAA